MAGYNAEIRVAVAGLEKLKLLEDRVSQLQGRFTKLNAAIANLGKFTQPKLTLNTTTAERQIAGVKRQIQSLNAGTTTVKVRLAYDSSGSSRGGGNGAAAAAAAGAFGGFSASGSAASMRSLSESMKQMGSSSSFRDIISDLHKLEEAFSGATATQIRHRTETEAVKGAFYRAKGEVKGLEGRLQEVKQESTELTASLSEMQAKLASLNGVKSTFAG
jgi:chromosome segregation ATPase